MSGGSEKHESGWGAAFNRMGRGLLEFGKGAVDFISSTVKNAVALELFPVVVAGSLVSHDAKAADHKTHSAEVAKHGGDAHGGDGHGGDAKGGDAKGGDAHGGDAHGGDGHGGHEEKKDDHGAHH